MYSPSSILQWISLSCLVALVMHTVSVSASARVFNGMVTTIAHVPYIVQLRDENNRKSYCGGTLVAPKYVVTAAHCFLTREPEKVLVVGGANTRLDAGVERRIVKLFVHPEYDENTVHTDIVVLELDSEMRGQNIQTVPLCRQPVKEGSLVQVSGWGQTEWEDSSHELRTVRIPVTSSEMCAEKFGPFVEKNMFCASGLQEKSPCPGDSGGPVMYGGQLCGVVALGYKCGAPSRADAFTDVYAVRSFIEGIIRS